MWRHTWGVGLYMTLWDCSAIAAIRIVTTEPLTPRTANLDTEKHATQIQIQIGTQYKKKENISVHYAPDSRISPAKKPSD